MDQTALNSNDFKATWSVIGAPLSRKNQSKGVKEGPEAIRRGGLIATMEYTGIQVEDCGDLIFNQKKYNEDINGNCDDPNKYYTSVKDSQYFGDACYSIFKAASRKFSENKKVLTLGGDHSIATGSIAASLYHNKDLSVLWIDAHSDINTPDTSPSGNYHGMPMAHLTGIFEKRLKGFDWLNSIPRLDPRNVCIIALRDLESSEQTIISKNQVPCFTMHDIDKHGIGKIVQQALQIIDPLACRPLHMSFDIDSCDPSIAPGTGTKVSGGLTYREARFICEEVAATQRLVSMDLVEVDPYLDANAEVPNRQRVPIKPGTTPTVRLALELIASSLGKKFTSYVG